MLSNSFSWWLANLGITIAWMAAAVMTGAYILIFGSLIYIAMLMLLELPDASSEEGSADDDSDGLPL